MKQLYFILVTTSILAGCQPQEEVVKSHGIKEVHLVQFRYSYPGDNIEDNAPTGGDTLEFKPQVVGYTSLEPKSGQMEVWYGFHYDSIFYHPYGHATRPELGTALSYLAQLQDDQSYYHDWKNSSEPLPLYCGPSLFFQVVKEDDEVYTIGFAPSKLPKQLEGLYRAMDYNLLKMSNGQRITDASTTRGDYFLKVIHDKLYDPADAPPPDLPPPPPPVRATVKYTPPPAADN